MPSIQRLNAMAFMRVLETGTTRPCVFACEDDAGNTDEYVVKLRNDVRASGLCFEYVAARLAHHFELPMPDSALIGLSLDLAVAQKSNAVICDRIIRSAGLNFGTRYLVGLTTWPTHRRVPHHQRQEASSVLAFDALIDNADRRTAKPNLLAGEHRLFIIDHELAFGFVRLVNIPIPWRERLRFLRDHPLFDGLRGTELELSSFTNRLLALSDDIIDAICTEVPVDFGREHLPAIAKHLRAVRDDSQAFVAGLMEVAVK